jgi:chitinase
MGRVWSLCGAILLALPVLCGCDRVLPKYEFDLTRLAADGMAYKGSGQYGEEPWSCVRDNKTALTWEVKTAKSGLHNATNTYTWYGRDAYTTPGTEGKEDGGACVGSRCDTDAYIAAVNAERLCGYADWRLASTNETSTLIDATVRFPGPTVPAGFFPNIQNNKAGYWTGTEFDKRRSGAWVWRLDHGADFVAEKDQPRYVMAVRGGTDAAKKAGGAQP